MSVVSGAALQCNDRVYRRRQHREMDKNKERLGKIIFQKFVPTFGAEETD